MSNLNRICIICARGGSQGIPHKNIKKLNGKPLIAYTIEQAIASKLFSHIVLSTDCDDISEIGKIYGAEAWFKRPSELATNESGKYPAILHAVIEAERKYNIEFDIICDLQATSPLRSVEDLIQSMKMFENGDFDNLITGTQSNKSPYYDMVERVDNTLEVVKLTNQSIYRRQDAPITYDMNGSIYLWWRKTFFNLEENSSVLFKNKTALFEMPRERSVDIDDMLDWNFAEFLLSSRN